MRGVWLGIGSALALSACERPVTAPRETGVCWQMSPGPDGQPYFRPFATGIENLESCAARLEGLHLAGGRTVDGAFQGRFIFVTEAAITAGPNLRGQHYRVFSPSQREEIRRNIRTLQEREKAGG